jgi:hypothetical protein
MGGAYQLSAILRSGAYSRRPFQHPGDAQILVEVGPMNARWHDLEVGTLLRRCSLQPWVPIQRGRDLAAIRERDDKLSRGELDPLRAEIASLNLHDF